MDERSVLPHRLMCMDNLRFLLVLGVITFHSTSAYVGATYFVMDPHPGQFTRAVNHFLPGFTMDVLFFIAGFFVLPSLERKGPGPFVLSKLRRLGIPLLLGSLFVNPISTYLAYAAQHFQGLPEPGYWNFWKTYVGSILRFPTAHIGGASFSANLQFHYHHLWFLALLLTFCLVFGLLAAVRARMPGEWRVIRAPAASNAAVSLAVLVFAGLSVLADDGGSWLRHMRSLRPLYNVVGGSPWQISGEGLFFIMGIYAYSKRWFVNGTYPAPVWGWVVLWLAVLYGDHFGIELRCGPLRQMVWVGLLTGLAFRFLDRSSRMTRSLAANSYSMYVIHFPIVVLLQWLLLFTGLPTTLKFLLCAVTAICASWAISNYLIRPSPRRAVAGLLILFAVMALTLHPAAPAQAAAPAAPAVGPRSHRAPPDTTEIVRGRMKWLSRRLELTPTQRKAIKPVLERQIRLELRAQRRFSDTLRTLLDKEQWARYRRMQGH